MPDVGLIAAAAAETKAKKVALEVAERVASEVAQAEAERLYRERPPAAGKAGLDGIAGPTGKAGVAGPQGDQGIVGPAGPTGPKGPKGDPGEPGKDGRDGKDAPTPIMGSGRRQQPAGGIAGITVKDDGTGVGSANGVTTINFTGGSLTGTGGTVNVPLGGGSFTPAAFVEPTTATPEQIADALIAAGLMEAS